VVVGSGVGVGVSVGVGVVDPELVEGVGSAGLDVGVGVEVGLEFPAGAGVGVGVSVGEGAVVDFVDGLALGGSLGPATSAFCVFVPATSSGDLINEDFSGISILLIDGVLIMDDITMQIIRRSPIAPPAMRSTFGRGSE
jgi:hypothetical protein